MKKLSVIVPCCNEEANVDQFPRELIDPFKKFPFSVEYIFVDDGSTDETLSRLQSLFQKESGVTILSHSQNQGLGSAIRTGLKAATGDAVLTLDADLTFHPSQFPLLLDQFNDQVDCVMGSPFLGHMEGVSFFRRLLSSGVNSIYSWLLGQKLTAASSIFRLYRTRALLDLPLLSRSFNINAEILWELLKNGGRVVEVPVVLTQRTRGFSKIKAGREIVNHLKIFFRILNGRRKIGASGSSQLR